MSGFLVHSHLFSLLLLLLFVVLNQGWRGVSGTMKSFRLPVGRLLNSAKVLLESNVIVRRIASCFPPYVDDDDD